MRTERPNILIVILHDLGTHLGCYGHPEVASPHLDGLAADGARFTHHVATACYCSPSRGSVFTGKYPHCNGLMGLVNLDWDLPSGNRTLAMCLHEAGYRTRLFGLQHEAKDAHTLGFDHYEPCPSRRCRDVAPVVARYLREDAGEGGQPFYARVGFFEVHRVGPTYAEYAAEGPGEDVVHVPPYLADTPGAREDLNGLCGAVRRADAAVGDILAALTEAGLDDNTLVVFTNDHGIAFPRAKGTLYDPGIHTSLLMRWPGRIGPGTVHDALIGNVDLLPTLLEATGVPVPENVDGQSFLALLTRNGTGYVPRDAVFAEKNTAPDDTKRAVRTARWKYIRNLDEGPLLRLPSDVECGAVGRDLGNAHLAPRPPVELYDLATDPWEQENLAGRAEVAETETALRTRLDAWMRATRDPALVGPIPRPPGEAAILERLAARTEAVRAQRRAEAQ